MSLPQPPKPTISGTALVVGVVMIFCFTIAGVVAVAIAVPEGANPGSIITILMASLAPTLGVIVLLAKLQGIGQTVDDLSNGRMDAKIRAGVADVLPDHLVDAGALEQLIRDRQVRDHHPKES